MLTQLTAKLKDLVQQYKALIVEKNAQFAPTISNLSDFFDWNTFKSTYDRYSAATNKDYDDYKEKIRPCIDGQVITDSIAQEAQTIIDNLRNNTQLLIDHIEANKQQLQKINAAKKENSADAKTIIDRLPALKSEIAQGGQFDNLANDVKIAQQKTNERYKESRLLTDTDHVNNSGKSAISNTLDALTSGKPANNSENDDYNDPELKDGDSDDYKSFDDLPLTDAEGMNEDDVEQGSLGDCYALSTLAALARDKDAKDILLKNITKVKENLYEVTVYVKDVDKEGNQLGRVAKKVRVDTDFPADDEKKLAYAQARNQELWVIILEKAYAKAMGGYDNIHEGKGHEALAAFTGKEATVAYTSSLEFAGISSLVPQLKIAIFQSRGTSDKEFWQYKDGQKIYQAHAYSFQSFDAKTKKIKLRNPHGKEHLVIMLADVQKYFVSISSVTITAP